MAQYLVRAAGRNAYSVRQNAFVGLHPFGETATYSLTEARTQPDGTAVSDDSPPSAQELAAVVDTLR
jgi:hypothetical protein